VYGVGEPGHPSEHVRLGALSPRGEKSILTVPLDTLMRATYNPFFPYLAERAMEWVEAGTPPPAPGAEPVP
jgi:hypothetical protein